MRKFLLITLAIIIGLMGCTGKKVEDRSSLDHRDSEAILENMTGYYSGTIDLGSSKLKLEMNIEHDSEIKGSIDIKVQNLYDLVIENVLIDGNFVSFTVDIGSTDLLFEGVNEAGVYKGVFTQSGNEYLFVLELSEPKQVNYQTEKLEYQSDGITLVGEYIIANDQAPSPVALIIAGSGPTDMNGNSIAGVSADSYLHLAEALERNGISTLRYNKRTIGNDIREEDISFDHFIDDAVLLVDSLKDDERFSEVYVIGHSQGALIGSVLATRTEIDKLVCLTGAGQSIDQVLLKQLKPQVSEKLFEESVSILDQLARGNTVDSVSTELASIFGKNIQPFFISWIKYNPQDVLKLVSSETLIIVGDVDMEISVDEGQMLSDANPNARYVVISGMNHVLKESTADVADQQVTYQNTDLPLHGELIKELMAFFQ